MGTRSLAELLTEAYDRPDTKPFLFAVGATVRVKVRAYDDGQTPHYWDGAKVRVLRRYCSGLHKEHWYELQHPNGQIDQFREEEVDRRTRKAVKHEN